MGFSCTDRLLLSGFRLWWLGRKKHRIPELTKRSFFMPGRLVLRLQDTLTYRVRILPAYKGERVGGRFDRMGLVLSLLYGSGKTPILAHGSGRFA